MKIAYLLHYNKETSNGVRRKIEEQTTAWSERGHDVVIFHISGSTEFETGWSVPVRRFGYRSISTRYSAWAKACEAIIDWHPNVIYLRYDLFYPSILRLRRYNLIIEINTDDRREYLLDSFSRGFYNRVTRKFVLGAARGGVFVTRELIATTGPLARKPSIVIGNGINLRKHPWIPAPRNPSPQFIFLGTDRHPWHGVDKILRLAAYRPEWQFHVVGMGAPNSVGTASNIVFYGSLERVQYEKLLKSADFAIGTLGLHRKGMNEASPLKVREYLCSGLPTIIGYDDTDFPTGADFLLQLPNCENSIETSLDRIEAFTRDWSGCRVQRSDIEHLDTSKKEAQRLHFFSQLAGEVPREPRSR